MVILKWMYVHTRVCVYGTTCLRNLSRRFPMSAHKHEFALYRKRAVHNKAADGTVFRASDAGRFVGVRMHFVDSFEWHYSTRTRSADHAGVNSITFSGVLATLHCAPT